jgi:hypothetical protein
MRRFGLRRSTGELIELVADLLARHERARRSQFLEEPPRNVSGKVMKGARADATAQKAECGQRLR